jgi:hypothetical protein
LYEYMKNDWMRPKKILRTGWLAWGVVLVAGLTGMVRADADKKSIGLFAGSTSLAGIGYEKSLDENGRDALLYTAGSIAAHDIEAAQEVRRYFLDIELRPYVGLGVCEFLGSISHSVVLTVSGTGAAGIDWNIFEVYHCGAEVLLHLALFNFPLTGSASATNAGFLTHTFTFIPGVYVWREF